MKLLIRHAEKINSDIHAELTKKGQIDAVNYGKSLLSSGICVNTIVSSPIKRCIQTSELITQGLNQTIPILQAKELGDPGVYINDDQKAMDIFRSFSLLEIFNMQLAKQYLVGFNDIDLASQNLKVFFSSFKDHTIFISHDAIIVPYMNWYKKKKSIDETDLIDYLHTLKLKDV